MSARRRFPKRFLNLCRRQSAHRILVPAGRRAVAVPRTALRGRSGRYLAGMLRQNKGLRLLQQVLIVA